MSLSLYRKYRPQTFSDVSGQKAAIDVITNSILKSRAGHAYLFSGSRGCGKTSVARIFAKALNCLNREGFEPCGKCKNCEAITAGESLDVIEIDGASNNGVEEIRGLKANVTLAPFSSKYKIYIIDEVHMLSTAAFNALLKTLEEPPEHIIFILATTEPHKVPVTIRSRCQHIPFHSITTEDIFSRLDYVCKSENVNYEPEALWEISRQADGALRDALSLLEQVIAAGEINLQNVERTFGAGSRTAFERWIKLFRTDLSEAYINLKSMFDAGASGIRIFEEMFLIIRNLWLASQWSDKNIIDTLAASEQEKNFLREESKNWKSEDLHSLLNSVLKILVQARTGVRNEILLGMFMLLITPTPPSLQATSPQEERPLSSLPLSRGDVRESDREVQEAEVEEDINLKEKLLEIALKNDLVIYCGLFNAKIYILNGELILNFQDVYNYNVLRQQAHSIMLANMFKDYGKVILKFNDQKVTCETGELPESDFGLKPETENKNVQESVNNNDIEIDEPETEIEVPKSQDRSVFEAFKYKLMHAGLKPEVISYRRDEPEENENITEGLEHTEELDED